MVHLLSTTNGNLEQISYGCITASNILQKNYFLWYDKQNIINIYIYMRCASVGLDNKLSQKSFSLKYLQVHKNLNTQHQVV